MIGSHLPQPFLVLLLDVPDLLATISNDLRALFLVTGFGLGFALQEARGDLFCALVCLGIDARDLAGES